MKRLWSCCNPRKESGERQNHQKEKGMNASKHPKVAEGGQPSAKCGKWALWLIMITFVLPLLFFSIIEIFNVDSLGQLALSILFFIMFMGLPGCLVSLVLGVTAIIRNECPVKPAVLSVAISVWPALFALWILRNFLTMGEPW